MSTKKASATEKRAMIRALEKAGREMEGAVTLEEWYGEIGGSSDCVPVEGHFIEVQMGQVALFDPFLVKGRRLSQAGERIRRAFAVGWWFAGMRYKEAGGALEYVRDALRVTASKGQGKGRLRGISVSVHPSLEKFGSGRSFISAISAAIENGYVFLDIAGRCAAVVEKLIDTHQPRREYVTPKAGEKMPAKGKSKSSKKKKAGGGKKPTKKKAARKS